MKIDLRQLDHMDNMVVAIAEDIENHSGVEFTVSSLLRPGDKGVHGFGRGIDLSCQDHRLGEAVQRYVNGRYVYDPARTTKMCCLYHKVDGGAWHIHLQSHPSTEMRFHD